MGIYRQVDAVHLRYSRLINEEDACARRVRASATNLVLRGWCKVFRLVDKSRMIYINQHNSQPASPQSGDWEVWDDGRRFHARASNLHELLWSSGR